MLGDENKPYSVLPELLCCQYLILLTRSVRVSRCSIRQVR